MSPVAFHQVTYFEEKGAEVLRTRLRVRGDLTPTSCAGGALQGAGRGTLSSWWVLKARCCRALGRG